MSDPRKLPPWKCSPLDKWLIVGMNHYLVDGERRLYVAMIREGACIKEEGLDDEYLWNRLWHKAFDWEKVQKELRTEVTR